MSLPRPRLSTRGTAGYRFAELYLTRGPKAIGVTGDNSLPTLIGRTWALVLDVDGRLRLFQRAETAATWTEQTTLLPPLFAETHPESRRRFSIAFDQSARAVVAYEEDGVVYLTRWDTATTSYVQNVTVPGVDPVVVFDATWAYDIPVSDVLLFCLDASTRSRLLCRVQRDLYLVELELFDYEQPVVLDRVTRLPLRYQALASDEAGEPLVGDGARSALLSDLYPYPWRDRALVPLTGPTAGDYIEAIIRNELEETAEATLYGPGAGTYVLPIISYEAEEEGLVEATLADGPTAGTYVSVILSYEAEEEGLVEATLADGPTAGAYTLVVLTYAYVEEGTVDADMIGPTGGTYALA
ncbi:hypothetical protein [Natronococcus sp.]|uniref:hypothetical protein n=1 Tax=Natronococcus sp. TaxID=35747 RepID=UPI003A4DC46C